MGMILGLIFVDLYILTMFGITVYGALAEKLLISLVGAATTFSMIALILSGCPL